MSAFFNRVMIKGDIAHGTRVYLDGMELKGCKEATLELTPHTLPTLTVKMLMDAVDVDLSQNGIVRNADEDD